MTAVLAIAIVFMALLSIAGPPAYAGGSPGIYAYSQQTNSGTASAGASVQVSSQHAGTPENAEAVAPSGSSPPFTESASASTEASTTPPSEAPCIVAQEGSVTPCYGVVPGPAPAPPPAAGPRQPPVNPAALAAIAAARLTLGAGTIRVSPSRQASGLTGAATWFWLSPSPSPQSVSVSLRGEHVTVTATMSTVHWSFGDGGSLVGGAGVPYRPGSIATGAIRHVYQTRCLPGDRGHDPNVLSSCGTNGYMVAASVVWAISFQATGPVSAGGALPARATSTSIAYPVSESRAFLTTSGGGG